MGFAIWGACQSWNDQRYELLRPFTIGVLGVWCIEFMHFDWWSGWSFGYRHIVDTMVPLSLFLVPILGRIQQSRTLKAMFFLALVWSVMVQIVGVLVVNHTDWNSKPVYGCRRNNGDIVWTDNATQALDILESGAKLIDIIHQDVDKKKFRYRLWSVSDSQLVHYLIHGKDAYLRKFERQTTHDEILRYFDFNSKTDQREGSSQ